MKKQNKTSQRFLETCPRELNHFPKRICKWGLSKVLELDDKPTNCPTCPYYIKDINYKYCFWVYMSDQHNLKEHTLREIAELTGTSINNIKLAETSGIKRLLKNIKNSTLRSLLKDGKLEVD